MPYSYAACAFSAVACLVPVSAAAAAAAATDASLELRVARCELGAVGEAMDLVRSAGAASTHPQVEAIRHAAGRCTRFVLAVTPVRQVPQVCAAPASLTVTQTARELRRRMAAIDADALLRSSAVGQACRAAYLHELKTTRVVLRERK
jgi:hypothetical protein